MAKQPNRPGQPTAKLSKKPPPGHPASYEGKVWSRLHGKDEEADINVGGRPRKLFDYDQLEVLASFNLTDQEMADVFGVHVSMFTRRKKDDERFRLALESGRGVHKLGIRRAQYEKGVNDKDTSMLIWLGKQSLGQRDRVDAEVAHSFVPESSAILDRMKKLEAELEREEKGENDDEDA